MSSPHSDHDWTIHSLNIHGTFFERWCAKLVDGHPAWRVRSTNYLVRFPPEPPSKESSIDIVAVSQREHVQLTYVIECKKNNPEFIEWILFAKPGRQAFPMSHLMRMPASPSAGSWTTVRTLSERTYVVAGDVRETRGSYGNHKENKTKTKTSNAAISEAAYQVALGLQSLVWEERRRASTLEVRGLSSDRQWKEQVFLPVIVTTASLFLATFDPFDVSPSNGEIPYDKVVLKEVPFAVYEYPMPKGLQADDVRIEHMPTDDAIEAWSRLHIVIVNSRSLEALLKTGITGQLADMGA